MIELFIKYRKVITYLSCSVITAILETGLGWIFLTILKYPILITNTLSIVVGAVIHYILVLSLAFKKQHSIRNVIIYLVSFAFGILLQNTVIYIFYELILSQLSEFIRYFMSKFFSIAIPFIVIYKFRDFLYKKYN